MLCYFPFSKLNKKFENDFNEKFVKITEIYYGWWSSRAFICPSLIFFGFWHFLDNHNKIWIKWSFSNVFKGFTFRSWGYIYGFEAKFCIFKNQFNLNDSDMYKKKTPKKKIRRQGNVKKKSKSKFREIFDNRETWNHLLNKSNFCTTIFLFLRAFLKNIAKKKWNSIHSTRIICLLFAVLACGLKDCTA